MNSDSQFDIRIMYCNHCGYELEFAFVPGRAHNNVEAYCFYCKSEKYFIFQKPKGVEDVDIDRMLKGQIAMDVEVEEEDSD